MDRNRSYCVDSPKASACREQDSDHKPGMRYRWHLTACRVNGWGLGIHTCCCHGIDSGNGSKRTKFRPFRSLEILRNNNRSDPRFCPSKLSVLYTFLQKCFFPGQVLSNITSAIICNHYYNKIWFHNEISVPQSAVTPCSASGLWFYDLHPMCAKSCNKQKHCTRIACSQLGRNPTHDLLTSALPAWWRSLSLVASSKRKTPPIEIGRADGHPGNQPSCHWHESQIRLE